MSYKLLVCDVDGTLLDKDGVLSNSAKQALSDACHAGVRVALCTGRVIQSCKRLLRELSLDGVHIFFDGALISNAQSTDEVYTMPVPPEMVQELVSYSREKGFDSIDFYTATHFFVESESWASNIRRDFFKLRPTVTSFDDIWQRERIIKGTLVADCDADRERIKSFCNHFDGKIRFSWTATPAYPGVDFVNIIAPQVNKGTALNALIAHLDISTAEVAAIGDGINDLSLFENVGLSIAMGNATDEVKCKASVVTSSINDDGLSRAVNEYILK